MSRSTPLFIPLCGEWFDEFASGKKTEELRIYGTRWNERTCRVGRAAVLSRGYGSVTRLNGTVTAFRRAKLDELPEAQITSIVRLFGTEAPIRNGIAVISIEVER